MSCRYPLKGYKSAEGGLTFNRNNSPTGEFLDVPCGQCFPCRLNKSREWAVRMIHELRYHSTASFITLTYRDKDLPENGTLVKKHFVDFMKRLRARNPDIRISYYMCGEYGQVCENCGKSYPIHKKSHKNYNGCTEWSAGLGRPHYHAILYGVDFKDKEVFKTSKAGSLIYKSETLDNIWQKGFTSIGDVTFESCAYVARYVTKKINGEKAKFHYSKILEYDEQTGEATETVMLEPEYATMSRNPAIGLQWIEDYMKDVYPHDRVVQLRGNKSHISKPPRYYDKQYEKYDKENYDKLKRKRKRVAMAHALENSEERLAQKLTVLLQRTKTLERNFERYHDES